MGRLLIGLLLVAVGLVLLGDRLDYWNADDVIGTWWPLAIVGFGAAQLADRPRPWLGAGIVIAVGGFLLLVQLDVFTADAWTVIWPAALIVIGVWLVAGRLRGSAPVSQGAAMVSAFALLGEQHVASNANAFAKGSVTAVFGGAKLDLRSATLAPAGATVDAAGIFGGAEVIVPPGWDVRINGLPIFGGVEDKTTREGPAAAGAPTLTISALALFGGVEIKNDD